MLFGLQNGPSQSLNLKIVPWECDSFGGMRLSCFEDIPKALSKLSDSISDKELL